MTNARQFPSINTQNLAKMLVGFDDMFSTMENRFSNQLQTNYPPHNIIKVDENKYIVQMAVAGFKKDEITVEVKDSILTIFGERVSSIEHDYLYKGLAFRNFERSFTMVEHTVVDSATISDGVLSIQIERILPEEKKPKLITITEL